MTALIDGIINLSGPVAYLIVGLLAFGEAAAFVGLVLPGELAVILGGVMASSGKVSVTLMIAVVIVCAIAGDSLGYELGKHVGPRILAWPPFHKRFSQQVVQATSYLQEKGGRAVFLGRWTSILRALIPGLAGMARMPYRRFLTFNVLGGVAWGTTFVLAGYLAGSSWRRFEKIAGRASLLLLVAIIAAFGIRWLTRRLSSRSDAVRSRLTTIAQSRPVRALLDTFETPLDWARRRFARQASLGLGWTISAIVAGLGAYIVGTVVQDLLAGEELALIDRPVASWVAAHVTAEATTFTDAFIDFFAPPGGLWLVLAVAALTWRVRDRGAAIRVGIAAALSAAIALVLAAVLPVTVLGTKFPSVAVTWITAAMVVAVAAIGGRDLRWAIRATGAATFIVTLIALAELVSGEAALSGIVGGIGIGLVIGIGGEVTARLGEHLSTRSLT